MCREPRRREARWEDCFLKHDEKDDYSGHAVDYLRDTSTSCGTLDACSFKRTRGSKITSWDDRRNDHESAVLLQNSRLSTFTSHDGLGNEKSLDRLPIPRKRTLCFINTVPPTWWTRFDHG